MHVNKDLASPYPLGISFQDGLVRFALYSANAQAIEVGLFLPNTETPEQTVSLTRTGNYWHTEVKLPASDMLYAYRCHGDWDGEKNNYFNADDWLLDPYAKHPHTLPKWNSRAIRSIRAAIKAAPPFDWENVTSPPLSKENLIIYEMHVRGFTAHASSHIRAKGTYAAMIKKIPYLKKLGITAVELLPIHEFDERQSKNINPTTKKPQPNYWGYNTISFFAPKKSYSSQEDAITEFKTLVRELHKNHIAVILDVVYNHTGEGAPKDHSISFRGIDSQTYYMPNDYSGCGNTVNANHPQVQTLILDSLRYWVEEMHVDGFRFDLASILTRDYNGAPLEKPPLLAAIAKDPILSQVKLISEPWDAGGLYQVGLFPTLGPWSEWNGKYRDIVRQFLKGTDGKAGDFATALMGCDFLYHSSSPLSSVNFITAHDGFSLRDLVTYQDKHNEANGEDNKDGSNQNDSWNCGAEGETDNQEIQALRERQLRNHWLALLLSQGIPMILMGDEYGHTRHGNNNPYVQDNEINWFLWDEQEKNQNMVNFVAKLIAFRKAHPELRRTSFAKPEDITWHGKVPNQPDWNSRFVAFSTHAAPKLYVAFSAEHTAIDIELPPGTFRLLCNTADSWDKHHFDTQDSILPQKITLPPHTALLAIELT